MIEIRKAKAGDEEEIWKIIQETISTGDTYTFAPESSKEMMLAYWLGPDKHAYVAIYNNAVAGTFIMKDNQPGLGSHIANASYMVARKFGGLGIGKAMGAYSIAEAARLRYHAMQFNIVVSTNQHAILLWKKLGFEIIGEIPEAFQHRQLGLISAYIMYRKL